MRVPSPVHRVCRGALAGAAVLLLASACSEPTPPAPAAPVVKSAAARASWYQECWNHFNDKAWDQFGSCYGETAVSESVDAEPASAMGRNAIVKRDQDEAASFPDRRGEVRLILANGDRLASVALYTATNTGPMPPGPDGKAAPATGKSVGFLMAHTVDLDPTGSFAVRDAAYVDQGTLMSQLGVNPAPSRPAEKPTGATAMVSIAKNDDAEKANLAAAQAMFDALNKHDLKAMEALTPEDYHGMAVAEPKDVNKKESLAGLKDMFHAFPDVKVTPVTMWSAGEFVVVTGTFEGTNTGDMLAMGMKKTGKHVSVRFLEIMKLENGKVKDDWLFYNGAAMMAQLGIK